MEESQYSESIHGAKLLQEMKAINFERSFPVRKKLQIKFLKEEIVAIRTKIMTRATVPQAYGGNYALV